MVRVSVRSIDGVSSTVMLLGYLTQGKDGRFLQFPFNMTIKRVEKY